MGSKTKKRLDYTNRQTQKQTNSKSTFKISFHVDHNFNLNISNQILNKNINFYLYNGNHYYIRLNIVIKIVDNIIIKMKIQS